jgi:hypothetical protein
LHNLINLYTTRYFPKNILLLSVLSAKRITAPSNDTLLSNIWMLTAMLIFFANSNSVSDSLGNILFMNDKSFWIQRILNTVWLLSLISIIIACNNQQFDSKLWKEKDDIGYPNRKKMVDDLIKSRILIDLPESSMIEILGNPQGKDTTANGSIKNCWFRIVDYYGFDIDPKYSESLLIDYDTIKHQILDVRNYKSKDERNIIEKLFAN